MKRGNLLPSLAFGLVLGSVALNGAIAAERGQNGGNTQAAPQATELAAQSELIVKFKDTKPLGREIDEAVARHPLGLDQRNPANRGLIQAERARLRADLERAQRLEGQSRTRNLGKKYGVSLSHRRVLGTGADLVSVPKGRSAKAIAQQLKNSADVEYVEVNAMMQPMFTPNDSLYSSQWHYFESTGGLNLPTAWDSATGSGTVVAVLDTGIVSHTDLNANVISGYDFVSDAASARDGNGRDSNPADQGDWVATSGECYPGSPPSNSSWHGTHVAGTVAAVTNNNSGVAGVAYNAKIMPVRVLAKCGGSLADIADAIIWSSGGSVSGVPNTSTPADVINMSLGGSGSCGSTYQNAINTAVGNGTVVVVAAGNSNTNASGARPANCSNVVTVASNDRQGNRASYSNYGSVIDVTAPGGETAISSNGVRSTLNSGSTTPSSQNYAYYQGTSMATPHVAGVAALMRQVDGNITPASIESLLKSTARSLPGSCSGGCGSGIVDAAAAVAAAAGGPPPGGGVTELNNGDTVSGLSDSTGNWKYYKIAIPSGASNLQVNISGGSGDADLYLRQGAQPTLSTYNCRPWLSGNNESCSVASPTTGDYYIGIHAYSSYSGLTLTVSYTPPGGGGSGGGGTVENISASTGQWKYYTLTVPSGMSSLDVDISGGTGDADLYLRLNANPTTSNWVCRPYLNGNNESCSISNPTAGTWHIGIRAYSTFSGVRLDAFYSP